ncbi:hypothetical protein I4641_05915 [Waterburya agarophytonicola K14]|uniref:Uncharacterized protein n=1 Tax=Waterburya agarophytonicola KI4 TaxID=2874699 RepID=A0A964BNT1_9CYAN|nr:hypothetical protein [Waterburya agarophytonicola]MCC0176514.1 hypothetical protein [Waterburya agarophytonicola KI4]
MKNSQDNKGILSLLLKNSIVQFIAGMLSLSIILRISQSVDYQLIEIILKSLGYGFFCYLTTPFVIYWLAYVSQGIATAKKLTITVALIALYSYIIWDAYFFFRSAFAQLAQGLSSSL